MNYYTIITIPLEAATAKARSPLDLSLDWGTARSPKLDDLRGLVVE